MNLALSDEQVFLREAARGALSRFKTLEAAREALDGNDSLPDLWPTAMEAGWPGLLIDEAHGGAGLDVFDAMLVLGECGRVLAGVALLGHLPATAILGEAPAGAHLLEKLATGAQVVLQGPRQHLANATGGAAFEMRPDAAALNDDRHPVRIYDVKWKRLDTVAANSGIAREDIYQMASYASGYDCRHISLLYPCDDQVNSGLVETFKISDVNATRVDVFTLDLQALVSGATEEGAREVWP